MESTHAVLGQTTRPSREEVCSAAASRGRFRTIAAWLACLGLISNFLLPVAPSLAFGVLDPGRGAFGSSLCTPTPGSETPGKNKSALVIHHCALCNAPAVSLSRRDTEFRLAAELNDVAYPALDGAPLVVGSRHGPTQARAPPRIV